MKGIATTYKGIRFRSRLEAKWASYLDAIRWPWTYEPFDLDGYIPDFVIDFPYAPLLLEVKPETSFDRLDRHTAKVEASGWEHDALIVGARLWEANIAGMTTAGWLSQRWTQEADPEFDVEPGPVWAWGEGTLIVCPVCEDTSIYNDSMGWYCYRCGGGHKVYLGPYYPWEEQWNAVTNATQWTPGRVS